MGPAFNGRFESAIAIGCEVCLDPKIFLGVGVPLKGFSVGVLPR